MNEYEIYISELKAKLKKKTDRIRKLNKKIEELRNVIFYKNEVISDLEEQLHMEHDQYWQ